MVAKELKTCRMLKFISCGLILSVIGIIGLIRCSRDNPFDPNSSNFKKGATPEVRFTADFLTCFVKDTLAISIHYKDSLAKGGAVPAVKTLFFSWNGDASAFTDSMAVSGNDSTIVIRKAFTPARDTIAYVQARDNDGERSATGSMRLVVRGDKVVILGVVSSSSSALIGDTVTLNVSAKDNGINGTIKKYIWIVNSLVSPVQDSVLKVAFNSSGIQTIVVQVQSSDSVLSAADTIKIAVSAIKDTLGPDIQIQSPADSAVYTPKISVMVQARDPSGVSVVFINGNYAKQISGNDTLSLCMLDTFQLIEGPNTIKVQAWDGCTPANPSTKSATVTYIKQDTTPPAVLFSTPHQNDTVYRSPTTIAVSVTDLYSGVKWVKCNNDTMSNTSGSSYSSNVVLKEGKDTLFISAADKKGNTVTDTLMVTYIITDKVPPVVQIIKPAQGEQLATDFVQVRVTASDAGSGIDTVFINGQAASLSIGHYVLNVPLKHGYDTIRVVATDASANHNTTKDSVIVARNNPPRFAPDSSSRDTTLFKDSAATIKICAVDDDTDAMSFAFLTPPGNSSTIPQINAATGGCATITGYTPDSIGLDTFSVSVTDNYAGADTVRMRVFVISPSATKPYFTTDPASIPDKAVAGTFYAVQLAAKDPNDKSLSYSLGAPPTPAGVSIDPDARVAWTPGVADTGGKTIVAYVDNGTERDTIQWSVVVTMPDQSPNLQNPGNKSVSEMNLLTFTLAATDPDNDSLLYSFGSSYPPGAVIDSLRGVFTWTPTYKDSGVYAVVFKVTEKHRTPALADLETITVTVNNVNNAPVMVNPGNKTIYESELLSFNLQATDINGDALLFSMKGAPAGALISNGSNFTWRPTTTQTGAYPLTFYVTDNGKPVMSDSAAITITVKDSTVPVFAAHALVDTTYVGTAYSTTVKAVDGDGDSLVYAKRSGPDGLAITGNYGGVAWKPVTAGTYDVTISAADHAGNTGTVSWKILVLPKWPRVFGNANTQDTGFSVIQTTDGGYALCGTIAAASGGLKWPFFIRTDTSGNPLQFKMYGSLLSSYASANSIQQTSDGGFIICGSDSSGAASKLLLIKTNGFGDTIWTARLGQTGSALGQTSEKGTSVCQTTDGSYFLACGVTTRQGSGPSTATYKMYVVKVSTKTGAKAWDTTYSSTNGNSVGFCIQPSTDYNGGFIVCGESVSGSGGTGTTSTDLYLVRAGSQGRIIWTRSIHQTNTNRNVGLSVLQASDFSIVIGGYTTSGTIPTGFVMKVNYMTGQDVFWTDLPDNNSAVLSVKAPSNGDYVACGYTNSGGMDVLLHRFDARGDITLRKTLGGALNDAGFSVSPTKDNGFIITGFTTKAESKDNTDIYLVKTDSQGDVAK